MENKLTFEESLKRLDEIVKKLESGNVSLEESLKLFSEGKKLSNQLEEKLKKFNDEIIKVYSDGKLEEFKEE